MKKRLISLILCVVLALTPVLTACGGNGGDTSAQESVPAQSVSPVEESSAAPVEESSAAPIEESSVSPVEESSVSPVEESSEAPVEESSVSPIEESSAEPVEESSEEEIVYDFIRGKVKYSDMVYERPDFESLNAKIAEGEELLKKGKIKAEEMKEFFEALTDDIVAAITQNTLIDLKQSLDTADTELQDESELLAEEIGNVKKDYFQFANRLLDSKKYSEKVFEEYTEAEKQEIRDAANSMDEEYVALEKRLTELQNNYNDCDSIVVTVGDTEMTLEEVYKKYGSSKYNDLLSAEVGKIYVEIVEIEKKMAQKAGATDVVAHIYEKDYHRDYTIENIQHMYDYVKEYIVPLFKKYLSTARSSYYRAGDYNNIFTHEDRVKKYLASINPKMLEAYEYLKEYGLYISGDADKMRDGAYTTILYTYDVPIIYQKFSGGYDNLQTFIHEFGHFYEFYTYGENATTQLDVDEIHSQANELLFLPVYNEIFGEASGKKITRYQLFLCMYSILQTCVFAEFETRVFEGNYKSGEELNALFAEISKEYSMSNMLSATIWTQVHHIFLYPHYYISYGTSIIPALQIYAASVKDRDEGIRLYNEVIAHSDYETPFLEVLKQAGLKDPFSEETFKEIAEVIIAAFPKS